MTTDHSGILLSWIAILLGSGTATSAAADIAKAANSEDFHLGICWVGGLAPGPDDIAVWGADLVSNPRSMLVSDVSWRGIRTDDASPRRCQINQPNVNFATLSIGAGGIDNRGTTTANNATSISTDVRCTADQIWRGVAGSGTKFLLGGAPRYDDVLREVATFLDLGGHTITLENVEVSLAGNTPSDHSVTNGNFVLNNSSIQFSSANRWKFPYPNPTFSVPDSISIQINAGSTVIPNNKPTSSENLHWNAAITLNGGTLHASGWGAQIVGGSGTAFSSNNTLGGTILVTADSDIVLSDEIGAANEGETLHKISADLTGAATLDILNNSATSANNLIVLSGDNSGFTGTIRLVAPSPNSSKKVRLSGDASGSAAAQWLIAPTNTLEIETSSVSLGTLGGSGTIRATGCGDSTLSIGGGTFSGVITQDLEATLHLRKFGPATHTLQGDASWNGDTNVEGGELWINDAQLSDRSTVSVADGAKLTLAHGGVDTVRSLVLGGAPQQAGLWGAPDSGATFETDALGGTGKLMVSGLPATTPFEDFMAGYPAIPPADQGAGSNPDGSQFDNFGEFAFAGDPADPGFDGTFDVTVGTSLALVIAVRCGAEFHGGGSDLASDPIDGIVYRIQASTDLIDFTTQAVIELPGFVPDPDLLPLPSGWEYRRFTVASPASGSPRQFIRAIAAPAP